MVTVPNGISVSMQYEHLHTFSLRTVILRILMELANGLEAYSLKSPGPMPLKFHCNILSIMAHLHCRRWTWVQTWIQILNLIATLHYAVHIAQTWTHIPTSYFCVRQETESKSVPGSVSGNANEPLVFVLISLWMQHNDAFILVI